MEKRQLLWALGSSEASWSSLAGSTICSARLRKNALLPVDLVEFPLYVILIEVHVVALAHPSPLDSLNIEIISPLQLLLEGIHLWQLEPTTPEDVRYFRSLPKFVLKYLPLEHNVASKHIHNIA